MVCSGITERGEARAHSESEGVYCLDAEQGLLLGLRRQASSLVHCELHERERESLQVLAVLLACGHYAATDDWEGRFGHAAGDQ